MRWEDILFVMKQCLVLPLPFVKPFVRPAGGGLETAQDAFRPDALGVAGAHSAGQTPGRRPALRARSHAQAKPNMASGVGRSEHPGRAHTARLRHRQRSEAQRVRDRYPKGGDASWRLRSAPLGGIEPASEGGRLRPQRLYRETGSPFPVSARVRWPPGTEMVTQRRACRWGFPLWRPAIRHAVLSPTARFVTPMRRPRLTARCAA
jgi:hypothetical protein